MTLTKADLAASIVEQADLPRKLATTCIDVILQEVADALVQGDKVEIRGFGSFRTRQRGPRDGRNPRTGEPVQVPPKRVVYFTPGKMLRKGLFDADPCL